MAYIIGSSTAIHIVNPETLSTLSATQTPAPTYLVHDRVSDMVYCVNEVDDGMVTSFKLTRPSPDRVELAHRDSCRTLGAHPGKAFSGGEC